MAQIDREVQEKGVSRAQWLAAAAGAYLRLHELNNGADPAEMAQELAQLRSTNEGQWREIQQLKRAEEKAREEAAQSRRKLSQLEDQYAKGLIELEKVHTDMSLLGRDLAHYQDTINLKDQEIAFLQAHISQLTQSISQLALPPPSKEAATRRKRWWFL